MNLTLITPEVVSTQQTAIATHVTFRLGRDLYALPIANVQFLSLLSSRAPDANGKEFDSLDVRSRLGLPENERGQSDGVIVVITEGQGGFHRTALIVDDIEDVVPVGQIEAASPYVLRTRPDCVLGTFHLGQREVTLLDIDILVSPETHKRPSLAA